MKVIEISKTQKKAIDFVSKAAAEDDYRPVLQGVKIEDNGIVASDGVRMHWVSVPIDELENGVYALTPKGAMCIADEIPGEFPDFKRIIQDDFDCEFHVDPRLLADALKMFDKDSCVTIRIGNNAPRRVEVSGYVAKSRAYALIMQMRPSNDNNKFVTPKNFTPEDNQDDE